MMWLNFISGLHDLSTVFIVLHIHNKFVLFSAIGKTTSSLHCSESVVIKSVSLHPKAPYELDELWIWTDLSTHRLPGTRLQSL